MSKSRFGLLCLFSSLLLAAPPLFAQALPPIPLGRATQANALGLGDQRDAVVAANPSGLFAMSWGLALDGLRRFGATGLPLTGNLALGALLAVSPVTTVTGDGTAVVVWTESLLGNTNIVYSQCGLLCGLPHVANTGLGANNSPAIAARGDNSFLVVWVRPTGAIAARLFDGAVPLTGELTLSGAGAVGANPSVAWNSATDGFGVVWNQAVTGQGQEIFGIWLDDEGDPEGAAQALNSEHALDQRFPDIAFNSQGDAGVVWQTTDSELGEEIRARVFDPDGDPVDAESAVNVETANDQERPAIAACSNDDFVTVWRSNADEDPDPLEADGLDPTPGGPAAGERIAGSPIWVVGRAHPHGSGATLADVAGLGPRAGRALALDTPFVVAGELDPDAGGPDIASQNAGSGCTFVVGFDDFSLLDWDVYYRRYSAYGAYFADSFETGDTSQWSIALP